MQDVWAGLSPLVEKLAHGELTLRETIKKSRGTRLRAEREAQTARSGVKGLKGSLRLKEQQFLEVVQCVADRNDTASQQHRDEVIRLTVSFQFKEKQLQEEVDRAASRDSATTQHLRGEATRLTATLQSQETFYKE